MTILTTDLFISFMRRIEITTLTDLFSNVIQTTSPTRSKVKSKLSDNFSDSPAKHDKTRTDTRIPLIVSIMHVPRRTSKIHPLYVWLRIRTRILHYPVLIAELGSARPLCQRNGMDLFRILLQPQFPESINVPQTQTPSAELRIMRFMWKIGPTLMRCIIIAIWRCAKQTLHCIYVW